VDGDQKEGDLCAATGSARTVQTVKSRVNNYSGAIMAFLDAIKRQLCPVIEWDNADPDAPLHTEPHLMAMDKA